MAILSYLLIGEEAELTQQSTTAAMRGQVQVALKHDSEENPTQVYSEWVANRLAQFLGLPVALGVVARYHSDPRLSRFASLWVADPETHLFDFTEAEADPEAPPAPDGAYNETGFYWQFKQLCDRYPIEAAQLAVFDLWIGNEDRDLNIKGQLDEQHTRLVFALDQGNALLSCGLNPSDSLDKLEGVAYPAFHPMMGLLGPFECGEMVERISAMPDWALLSAVVAGVQIGSVLPDRQYELYDVLDRRRKQLRTIVQKVLLRPSPSRS